MLVFGMLMQDILFSFSWYGNLSCNNACNTDGTSSFYAIYDLSFQSLYV